ncbi:MAG: hypothetical protein CL681_25775 [Blastopirellula sp.]|nr:hypothetical protein [Blastopirellula sp.]
MRSKRKQVLLAVFRNAVCFKTTFKRLIPALIALLNRLIHVYQWNLSGADSQRWPVTEGS